MNVLDLFSGIGGFSLGLERAGMQTVAFCENNPFCKQVLAKHWPEVPILDDVSTAQFPHADVVVGGFPCQDISLAGKRAGVSGNRSGLYRELVRAIRLVRPRHAIMENVAALLGNGMGTVLADVAESGYNAEWDCVPACALGAPHERDRVWIVAHAIDAERGQISGPCDGLAGNVGIPQGQEGPGGLEGVSAEVRVAEATDAARIGCGQGREGRPPDSFAGIRVEARRNTADPYGARLAFRESLSRDAWEEQQAAQRSADQDGEQQIWPAEPALSGVDDEIPDWMDRVAATGNTLVPYIPELIGLAIMQAAA